MKWLMVPVYFCASETALSQVPLNLRGGHTAAAAIWFVVGLVAMFATVFGAMVASKR